MAMTSTPLAQLFKTRATKMRTVNTLKKAKTTSKRLIIKIKFRQTDKNNSRVTNSLLNINFETIIHLLCHNPSSSQICYRSHLTLPSLNRKVVSQFSHVQLVRQILKAHPYQMNLLPLQYKNLVI